ncbi:GNAT family N-acetyltransferase [Actinophytocola sp.]|uniref:GNAT family N-acetyltransferase n=1 Tax=Actinophytocola sp. TaxID=1872138 RepID=UPI002D3E0C67|nr:GNAT family N-acetyltransferase [Actinophytocola sp.]HYQ62649.1 GNAT family N-acetyltransferase [Actinophytocola sp.]
MPAPAPRFRSARAEDAPAVAGLHADSWQRHYRGAYADTFLDDEAPAYLARMWTERLAAPADTRTILAEHDGELVGLAHTFLDNDPRWGALVDNLHVRHTVKRQGIGTRLLALTAAAVLRWSPTSGLYLWVLEQNATAQAFYAARGGERAGRGDVPAPGGDVARLNGKPACFRFAWRAPSSLLVDHDRRSGSLNA